MGDAAMTSRGKPLPVSFEARGASVPFTTRNLLHCRLRVVDNGRDLAWEASVPAGIGEVDAQGVMILPWDNLPGFSKMSERDRALYESIDAIEEPRAPDPFTIRDAALRIDAGGADPTARAAALRARERDAAAERRARMALLAGLVRTCGAAAGDPFMAAADPVALMRLEDGAETARGAPDMAIIRVRALEFAATRHRRSRERIEARLAELAAGLAPLGGIDGAADGHLVHLRDRVAGMDGTMARQARTMRAQTADMTAMVRFAITDFLDYANARLARLAEAFSDVDAVFREEDWSREVLDECRRDVGYALDGWHPLCRAWEAALGSGEPEAQHDAVRHILTVLPLMPDEEVNPAGERGWIWQSFGAARNQMVRTLVGWTDNEIDAELADRLAAAREREAAGTRDEGEGMRRRRRRQTA